MAILDLDAHSARRNDILDQPMRAALDFEAGDRELSGLSLEQNRPGFKLRLQIRAPGAWIPLKREAKQSTAQN